jgi:hypothetical protein
LAEFSKSKKYNHEICVKNKCGINYWGMFEPNEIIFAMGIVACSKYATAIFEVERLKINQ